jgi:hypothetical protein
MTICKHGGCGAAASIAERYELFPPALGINTWDDGDPVVSHLGVEFWAFAGAQQRVANTLELGLFVLHTKQRNSVVQCGMLGSAHIQLSKYLSFKGYVQLQ